MISRITIFWLVALGGMVLMTVTVSLEVDRVKGRIDAVAARQSAVEERIALLDASYQSLTAPDQLRPLADRHLPLQEVRGDQLIALDQLPARIPLPTARRPAPRSEAQQFGENTPPAPALPPPLPDTPARPPWLEAQGVGVLQPVNLVVPRRRPQ